MSLGEWISGNAAGLVFWAVTASHRILAGSAGTSNEAKTAPRHGRGRALQRASSSRRRQRLLTPQTHYCWYSQFPGVFIIGTPTLLQGSDAQDERGIP
jgi:hypothetical protein